MSKSKETGTTETFGVQHGQKHGAKEPPTGPPNESDRDKGVGQYGSEGQPPNMEK